MSKPPHKNSPNTKSDALEDELQLFRQEMHGVTPLKQDKIAPVPVKKSLKKLRNPIEKVSTPFCLSDNAKPTGPEEQLSYAQAGVQTKTLKKLKKGQIEYENGLDLHGSTIEQAAEKLERFLTQCHSTQTRCVLIIHGRGLRSQDQQPVLKQQLNHWLRNDFRILAFHSAIAKDGGCGAVYVLLKKLC